jgi:hypothetical protein
LTRYGRWIENQRCPFKPPGLASLVENRQSQSCLAAADRQIPPGKLWKRRLLARGPPFRAVLELPARSHLQCICRLMRSAAQAGCARCELLRCQTKWNSGLSVDSAQRQQPGRRLASANCGSPVGRRGIASDAWKVSQACWFARTCGCQPNRRGENVKAAKWSR